MAEKTLHVPMLTEIILEQLSFDELFYFQDSS